ncbi:ComC/BlpC family leader-containing pheromone/bacteriocin [Streptococcus pneumoniae]
MDKKQTLAQFKELPCSELHHISGGDWWTDFFNRFTQPQEMKINGGINKHQLG